MYRPRIIPVLLLKNKGLVKSIKFKNHRYIGDPINAVRIFNELKADELAFIDILATREKRTISPDFVRNVGEEANMPFSAGGGIRTLEDIRRILGAGAEKVILNTIAGEDPVFVRKAADTFGTSTISVCIDVKKNVWGKEKAWIRAGEKSIQPDPVRFAKQMEENGAGEIVIQSIDRDGTMKGYDIDLVKRIAGSVGIPVVCLGGAGEFEDMVTINSEVQLNGLAAGSLFIYHGKRRAVLVNYPEKKQILKLSDK
ncbi:MAG: AglZ/HisF2 family acetamidino modification protein [Bacteroidales bacterium]